MPFKIWDQDDQGDYASAIRTSWSTRLGGEDYRAEAEELDLHIDTVLDRAVELSSTGSDGRGKDKEFVKRWAIGRAVKESGILDSPNVVLEQRSHLWLAMARKCRLGVRSSGDIEEQWQMLIPDRELEPQRIERDIFAMGLWLQEQELKDARIAFGGSLSNAREIQRRESLRSIKFRSALKRWFLCLDPSQRSRLYKGKEFVTLSKALQRRWPSRGPGSAKRPVHFTDHDLDCEVHRVLTQLAPTK